MANNPSTLPVTPLVDNSAFEERWANWLVSCREHDLEGQRRLRMTLIGAAIIALAIALVRFA